MNEVMCSNSLGILWVPAHVGVDGNVEADHLAKQVLKWSHIDMIIPLKLRPKSEQLQRENARTFEWGGKRMISSYSKPRWGERGNFKNRREDAIFTRLRLGLAALNYSLYRINKHKSRNCIIYGPAEHVEHVLIYCTAYEREKPYVLEELREMGIVSHTLNIAA